MTRDNLILDHINFAEKIAASQFKKTPRCVQFDELKSAAFTGLVQAANKYNSTLFNRIPFEAFAYSRISGEIKDYLRSLSWGRNVKTEVYEDYASTPESDFGEFFDDLTKTLSQITKKVLFWYYVEELTMKEIGEKLGLSITRVYQLLQDGIKKCKK